MSGGPVLATTTPGSMRKLHSSHIWGGGFVLGSREPLLSIPLAKKFVWVFIKLRWQNPNELFGQSNNSCHGCSFTSGWCFVNKLSLPQVFKLHEGRNYAKFCSQAWTQALILKVSQKKAEGPEGGGQGRGQPCIHGCSPVFDILEVFRERGGDLCVRASDMHPDPLAGTVSWIRKKQWYTLSQTPTEPKQPQPPSGSTYPVELPLWFALRCSSTGEPLTWSCLLNTWTAQSLLPLAQPQANRDLCKLLD